MSVSMVLTLTGPDRVGIVEEVTKALLDVGANVDTSKMQRLGGEFAVLMLASVPEERAADVETALEPLTGQGYKATLSATKESSGESRTGWKSYRIEVRGADHEGIVHEIARGLSQQGISIESAETGTTEASVSGATLFTMTALVVVPPEVAEGDWMDTLAEAGAVSNVDVEVTPA